MLREVGDGKLWRRVIITYQIPQYRKTMQANIASFEVRIFKTPSSHEECALASVHRY